MKIYDTNRPMAYHIMQTFLLILIMNSHTHIMTVIMLAQVNVAYYDAMLYLSLWLQCPLGVLQLYLVIATSQES